MKWWTEIDEYEPKNYTLRNNAKYSDDVMVLDTECSNIFIVDGCVHAYGEEGVNYEKAVKCGLCYIWMIGINGIVYYGRSMADLKRCVKKLGKKLGKIHADIFIHNLSYDFQPLRNALTFENVFARESRKVIRSTIKGTRIRVRDSYVLSQMSLDSISKMYNLNDKKITGSYDYNKIRTEDTELTEEELLYCEHDCLSLMEYIEIEKKRYGSIVNIPDTHTGKVRKMLKDIIKQQHVGNDDFAMRDWKRNIAKMHNRPYIFRMLCSAFMGGTVGVNFKYKNKLVNNVTSYDIKSAYIYEILKQKYPSTRFYEVDNDMYENSGEYSYLMKVRLHDIYCNGYFRYISLCKCLNFENVQTSSGKVVSAGMVELSLTNVDFEEIKKVYDIGSIEIVELYRARNSRMPKEIVMLLVQLYKEKENAASSFGKDSSEYKHIKKLLNAVYGMMVTNYVVDECSYDGTWEKKYMDDEDVEKRVNDLCGSELLPYQWGVWVTAYTRAHLWKAINHFGIDCVYCDTDCVKVLKEDDTFINEMNAECDSLAKEIYNLYLIDGSSTKCIGHFEKEYKADEFKSVSAKRYAYSMNGKVKIHISGIREEAASALNGCVDSLKPGIVFSEAQCGRKTKYYNDEQPEISIDGKNYFQKYGICIMPSSYKITGENDDTEVVGCAILC